MRDPYPRVRARVRRTVRVPGMSPSHAELLIWLAADRFVVHDSGGRPYANLVGEVRSTRGFGVVPQGMEGLMDAVSANSRPHRGEPTELRGDWTSGRAVIREAGCAPWSTDVSTVAPVAEQLLATGRETSFPTGREVTFLNRLCREYRDTIEGDEDGRPFRSEARWLVSASFVLLREIRDARLPELNARTEVVELAEGSAAGALPPDHSEHR